MRSRVFSALGLASLCVIGITLVGCHAPTPDDSYRSPAPIRFQKRTERQVTPAPSTRPPLSHPPDSPSGRDHPEWRPSSSRISSRWTTIVIHHSATAVGGAKTFDKFHRDKGWDELGYHFVIGNGSDTPDGFVEVGPRWQKQKHGAHCKTPSNYYNDHGIGICLVGDFTRGQPTRHQMDSLATLTRFLTQQCRIPPSRVTTHGLINRGTKCPGPNFRLTYLQRLVGDASASVAP